MVTGAGGMALLGFFSSLWQLVLKELPWLVLVYCLTYQALKGPPSLGSFSIGQLLALACGERGYSDGSTLCS